MDDEEALGAPEGATPRVLFPIFCPIRDTRTNNPNLSSSGYELRSHERSGDVADGRATP
jgi:hypothetical protein